jgi:hypothetical protein
MLITALVLLIAVVLYHVFTTLVDLFPFNNVRDAAVSERRKEVLVNEPILLLPVALVMVAAATGWAAFAFTAGGAELFIALGGLLLWWMPYLAGRAVPWATAGTGSTWSELHARTYAHTVIVLPRVGERPRPNLEHMILHTLMLAGAASCFWFSAQM